MGLCRVLHDITKQVLLRLLHDTLYFRLDGKKGYFFVPVCGIVALK